MNKEGNYIVHSLASFLRRYFRLFRFALPLFRRLRFWLGPVGQHKIHNRVEGFHRCFGHAITIARLDEYGSHGLV